MNPAPTFSVIINCLNAEKYLREAIDSVYAQTFSDWEIILWDNCSTDCTAEIAQEYDQRLKYFRGENTIPLGAARNRAIEKSKGIFIAFLDSDDWWYENKLEKCLKAFTDENIGLVFSNCFNFYSNGKSKPLYLDCWNPPKGKVFWQLIEKYFINFQSVVLRRKILTRMDHWFDESFEVAEDLDFLLRFSLLADAKGLSDKLCSYRIHANSTTWNKSSFFIKEKLRILEKLTNSKILTPYKAKEIEPTFLSSSYKTHGLACAYQGDRFGAIKSLILIKKKDYKIYIILMMLIFLPYFILKQVINRHFFT